MRVAPSASFCKSCRATRRSHATKATSAPDAVNSKVVATSTLPPCSSTSPLSKHNVPTLASSIPRQSIGAPLRSAATPPGEVVGTNLYAIQIDTRQNGTTIKKMDRHPHKSTSTPPILGPMAGASTTPMPKNPLARPCSVGSNARKIMIAGIGCTTPAASPSITRAASTSPYSLDSPPEIPPIMSSHMQPRYVVR